MTALLELRFPTSQINGGLNMKLKQLFSSTIASLLLTGPSFAADLPNPKAPPLYAPPPIFTWTGFYVGGQVGYQWTTESSGTIYGIAPGAVLGGNPNYNQAGVIGGGHIGYNYQINQIVLGIEGDVEGASFVGSGPYHTGAYRVKTEINCEASIRGRLGYAWDRLLIYGTGGAAFADVKDSYTAYNAASAAVGYDYLTSTRTGWTVGGGLEYFFRPNWTIRGEYRYTDLGTRNDVLLASSGGTLGANRHETFNSARIGVSYHFNFLAPATPLVAKY
jgi:outer membrane immunogenic protein